MIKLTNILSEIKVNTPAPTSNKVKDLIIKLVQNIDQSNMREIYNVLDKHDYGDLIFNATDADLNNLDLTGVKNLQDLYNDLKNL